MSAPMLKLALFSRFSNFSNFRSLRQLHRTCLWFGAHDEKFKLAQDNVNRLKDDPGNMVKLQMYALFKQGSEGKCNKPKPGLADFVGRAKWDAWNKLADMTQDDAQLEYIKIVDGLMKEQGVSAGDNESGTSEASQQATTDESGDVVVTKDGKMTVIRLNRPDKKNAIHMQMYNKITESLKAAGEDNSAITVITGTGDFYCSGNDLSNFMNITPDQVAAIAKQGGEILKEFVAGFIDHPKPLAAVVNGPTFGVAVTTLGLCDVVYATDRATFQTPFASLGQAPEGCSSYLFPKMMGPAKANEVLLFGHKMTAHDACERGLVTEVFPDHSFQEQIWPRLRAFAELPPKSLRECKNIVRMQEKDTLHQVNEQECLLLEKMWQSDECMTAILNFFQDKGKI